MSNDIITPLRAVLVGCGGITGVWLKALAARTDVHLIGLVDLDPAVAQRRMTEFHLDCVCGSDLAAMLDSLRPDVVFDCTVPAAHATVACCAMEYGCHVLGEKPLADSLANARRIIATAAARNRVHAVIQNRRYLPSILRYRDVVQSPQLGTLTELHADFYIGAHFGGFRAEMDHVLLIDMAIHTFDQARFLCGRDPEWVQAVDWNSAGSWFRHGASALMICGMSEGFMFTYRGSWCAEGGNTPWESSWRAIGTSGTALWDGGGTIRLELVDPTDEGIRRRSRTVEVPPEQPLELCSHAGVIDEFLTSLRNGGTPQTVCTDNFQSMAMVHASIISAEAEGRRVYLKEFNA